MIELHLGLVLGSVSAEGPVSEGAGPALCTGMGLE